MKTITEFAGPTLKSAAKVKQDLVTAGKTPEELPQALGDALKIEGEKLGFILNALEVVGARMDNLKRVVILVPTEGEKITASGVQKGDQYYRSEYYPPVQDKSREAPAERGERGRGGKDRDKKRGKRRGRRGDRPNERGNATVAAGGPPRLPKPREVPASGGPLSAQKPNHVEKSGNDHADQKAGGDRDIDLESRPMDGNVSRKVP